MAEFVSDNSFEIKFDDKERWHFYTEKAVEQFYYAGAGESGIHFAQNTVPSPFPASYEYSANISGEGIQVKADGEGRNKMVSGTVTDISLYYDSGTVHIAGLSVAARDLDALLRKNTAAAAETIFDLMTGGDDEVTLGFGKDSFSAGAGGDVVRGRSGNDTIDGGSGDDVLYGGTGKDRLTGGSGDDIFVFDTRASSRNMDVIEDFDVGDDTISLDHHLFRTLKVNADPGDGWFLASSGGKAKTAGQHLVYNTKNGNLLYDADGSGGGKAVVIADLDAKLKLTAEHFDIF